MERQQSDAPTTKNPHSNRRNTSRDPHLPAAPPPPPRPIVERSEGSQTLRETASQLPPWAITRPSAAVVNKTPSPHTDCLRFPYQLDNASSRRSLPPMPPGIHTSVIQPRMAWRPTRLDPSYRAFSSADRTQAVWRGNYAHPTQSRLMHRQERERQRALPPIPMRLVSPSSQRGFATSRSARLDRRPRPPSPQLTLEAASAADLSARSSTKKKTITTMAQVSATTLPAADDAFAAALAKLHKLFAPEDAALQESQSFSNVSEAQQTPLAFASVRKKDKYDAPRLPCVFMHGLFGFSTLTPVSSLPQLTIDYWRGVVEMLEENGVEVLVTNVKTSASIEERARDALRMIEERFPGREVNLLGHSMGGLDARFLTTCLKDKTFKVKSVTTIATPHLGSPFASYLLYDVIGRKRLPTLLSLVNRLGIPGGGEAFECLTTERMKEFNEYVPDHPDTRYYSWGAAFKPGLFNEFRFPHGIIWEREGHNDGLVSVESSKWGQYQGTLKATHIEIIGWGNAIQQWLNWAGGETAPFDTRDFYLMVCEDLARQGF